MADKLREMASRLIDPNFKGAIDSLDPIEVARSAAAKSKRRLSILTVMTCLAWIAATSTGVAVAHYYFEQVQHNLPFNMYRYASGHAKIEAERDAKGEDRSLSYSPKDYLTEKEYREYSNGSRNFSTANDNMLVLSQATMILTGIAALLSVWLIIASRRCTLKDINVNLASICHELSAMSQA